MTEKFNPRPEYLITSLFAKHSETQLSREKYYYLSLNKNADNGLYNITKHILICPLLGEQKEEKTALEENLTIDDALKTLINWEIEVTEDKDYFEKKSPPISSPVRIEAFKNQLKDYNIKNTPKPKNKPGVNK